MRSWLMQLFHILREGSISIILRKVFGYAKNAGHTISIFEKNVKNVVKKMTVEWWVARTTVYSLRWKEILIKHAQSSIFALYSRHYMR